MDILDTVKDSRAGATVMFLGTVRKEAGLRALEYEMYDEMVAEKINQIKKTAMKRFRLTGSAIVHRKGRLKIGENVVIVACSASHRKEAFEACQWMATEMKKAVPIWKKKV